MTAPRGITVTVSLDDDDPTTTSDLMALADLVSQAASELAPGATTRLEVLASPEQATDTDRPGVVRQRLP